MLPGLALEVFKHQQRTGLLQAHVYVRVLTYVCTYVSPRTATAHESVILAQMKVDMLLKVKLNW